MAWPFGKLRRRTSERTLYKWRRRSNNPNHPSPDFSALVDAVKAEANANRTEEQREDRGKAFREWFTITLLAATLFFLYRQVDEMVKVFEPIREQAEASKRLAEQAIKKS